jgi:tRNA(Ile)-lysidine synthase
MLPVTEDGLIRPLLHTSRAEVRAWADAHGILWREDSSNSNDGFARNLLRNKLMPEIAREFNPNLEGILTGTGEIAATEEDYWKGKIEPLYRGAAKKTELGIVLPVNTVISNHRAVQRRLIRYGIAELRGDLRSIDLQHIEAILAICHSKHGHDRVIVPGVDAIRSFGVLLLTKPGDLNAGERNYCLNVSWNEKLELPFGAGVIELSALNSNHKNCVNFKKESQFPKELADLDFEVLTGRGLAGPLQVRNWQPGDEILRPGHHKPEKIKSLFQEFQVLLWKRRHWPVAVVKDEIFWARGFGVAAPYLVTPESNKVANLCYWSSDDIAGL